MYENPKNAHKNAQKNSKNFQPSIHNLYVLQRRISPKNIAFYVPVGCFRLARYCGKLYSHHLFPKTNDWRYGKSLSSALGNSSCPFFSYLLFSLYLANSRSVFINSITHGRTVYYYKPSLNYRSVKSTVLELSYGMLCRDSSGNPFLWILLRES